MLTISNPTRDVILVPVLFIFHFFYQFFAGGYLLSETNSIDWGWETPLYAPCFYWMSKNAVPACVLTHWPWDMLYFLGITFLITIATAQVIQKLVNMEPDILGKYYWRLIVMLLGWVFVPVPHEMTLFYQFTIMT